MAAANATALCGHAVGDKVAARLAGLGELDRVLAPVHVDGRLHVWEWLNRADGTFCKTDALDHSCDHGLVGCQDIAWDIAGAALEFRLSEGEIAALRLAIAQACGRMTEMEAVALFSLCYAAFQGASWQMAEQAACPPDAAIIRRWRGRYDEALRASDMPRSG